MPRHLADIESDMSAIHRVDDMWSMEAGKFFRLARRLPAYQGVMRGIAEGQAHRQHQRTGGRTVVPVPAGTGLGGIAGKAPGLAELTDHGYATD